MLTAMTRFSLVSPPIIFIPINSHSPPFSALWSKPRTHLLHFSLFFFFILFPSQASANKHPFHFTPSSFTLFLDLIKFLYPVGSLLVLHHNWFHYSLTCHFKSLMPLYFINIYYFTAFYMLLGLDNVHVDVGDINFQLYLIN